jgi:hypothetical protein
MRARWVSERPHRPPVNAATVIAGWWPGKYLLVSTIECGDEILAKLSKIDGDPDCPYATQVFAYGGADVGYIVGPKRMNDPLYQRRYAGKVEAEKGHRETVDVIASGRLKI